MNFHLLFYFLVLSVAPRARNQNTRTTSRQGESDANNYETHHATPSSTTTAEEGDGEGGDDTNAPLLTAEDGQDDVEPAAATSMIDYFESLVISPTITQGGDREEDPERQEALSIIIDCIRHDPDGNTPITNDHGLFAKTKAKQKLRKVMLSLIASRIEEEDRVQRMGDAALKKWMTSDNMYRQFMFLKKHAIINIAATRAGVRLNDSISVDKLIMKLIETLHSSSPRSRNETTVTRAGGLLAGGDLNDQGEHQQQTTNASNDEQVTAIAKEITKAMLLNSFMKPLKGISREYCRMGHKLELPIGLDWMKDLNNKKLFTGFQIISLHKVGLVEKKNCPWAKDSIDFIAFVHDDARSAVELWGVEVKSRVTNTTISKEMEFGQKLRRKKYEKINADQVHKYFRVAGERFQVLHHAYVYGLERVIHIVANNSGKVMNGTLVEFDENIHQAYGKVVEKLKNMALYWAYDDDEDDISHLMIPNNIISMCRGIKTINGKETIYGALKLWKTMFSDATILPRPVLQRIIPRTHAQWNSTKGGSDTVTKLVDGCFLKPPRNYTNFESVAFGRCISNLVATILKLYHVVSAKDNVAQSYPSMQHYRNAASHRMTYGRMLRRLYTFFKEEAKDEANKENQEPADEPTNTGRVRRARAQGHSSVPELLDFCTQKTFQTPMKARRRQIEKGIVSNRILERTTHCTGHPIEIIEQDEGNKKDPRRECYLCSTKTAWRCTKCRLYFCMNYKGNKLREEKLYYNHERNTQEENHGTTKIYGKSCFFRAHEGAIRESEQDNAE